MEIINYNKKYSKQIAELFTTTIHNTCNKDYTKEQLNAWANQNIDYDSWNKRLEKTKPYLAIEENKIVGFIEYNKDYIDCFYIHYKYQNRGVGKALFTFVLNLAKQHNITKLKVDASITSKIFFKKLGFEEIRENKVSRDNQVLKNYSFELNI